MYFQLIDSFSGIVAQKLFPIVFSRIEKKLGVNFYRIKTVQKLREIKNSFMFCEQTCVNNISAVHEKIVEVVSPVNFSQIGHVEVLLKIFSNTNHFKK